MARHDTFYMFFRAALIVAVVSGGALVAAAQTVVQWSGPAPAEAAQAKTIRLLGHWSSERFLVSEILAGQASGVAVRAPALPVAMDLDLRPALFGGEGRVSVRADEPALVLRCEPGSAPAGVVLTRPGYRLPSGADLRIDIDGLVTGEFRLAVSDADRVAAENPLILDRIATGLSRIALPPGGLDRAAWRSFTILCPDEGGRLEINRLYLSPAGRPTSGARATWVWQAAQWQLAGDALLDRLAGQGFTVAFVTVPLTPDGKKVAEPNRLARFVRTAGRRGIAIWAVDGDPAAVLPAERAAWVRRARAFGRYNAVAARSASLAGLQLDIEPYILPEYVRDPAAIHTQYVDLLAALRGASVGMRLEVALPFWFADVTTGSGRVLDAIDVDGIVVMDYRTDPALIQQSAEPFLAWGAARGKPVRIALEYGALPDQQMLTFDRAESGRLWLTLTPTGPDLTLHAEAAANPDGASYRLVARRAVPADRVTFHGNPDRLWQTVGAVERAFAAWPSFAGIAIHEPPDGIQTGLAEGKEEQ